MSWCPGLISVQVGVSERDQQQCCRCIGLGSHQPQLGDHPISPRGRDCRAADWGEARVSKELLEHEHLSQEARVQVVKLAPMHILDWAEAQEADAALAAYRKWLHIRKDMPLPKQDTLLKKCQGMEAETDQGKMLFCICNFSS